VPALNEESTIAQVVTSARNLGFEVLVVDDGSSDKTSAKACEAGAHLLELSMNLGVGGALQSAFNYAIRNGFEAVIQLDADGQHPVEAIPRLIENANQTRADIVLASRFTHADNRMTVNRIRKFAMSILQVVASRACRTKITDSSSGFRLIRQPLLGHFAKNFPSHYLGDTFEALVVSGRKKYQVSEIPAAFRDRTHGQSSASKRAAILLIFRALVVTLFGLHFQLPKKI